MKQRKARHTSIPKTMLKLVETNLPPSPCPTRHKGRNPSGPLATWGMPYPAANGQLGVKGNRCVAKVVALQWVPSNETHMAVSARDQHKEPKGHWAKPFPSHSPGTAQALLVNRHAWQ